MAAPSVRTLSLAPVRSRSFSPTGTASTWISSYAIPPPSEPRTRQYWLAVMRYAMPITSGISILRLLAGDSDSGSDSAFDSASVSVSVSGSDSDAEELVLLKVTDSVPFDGVRGAIDVNVGSEYGSPGMFRAKTHPGTWTRAVASGTIPRLPVNFAEDLNHQRVAELVAGVCTGVASNVCVVRME